MYKRFLGFVIKLLQLQNMHLEWESEESGNASRGQIGKSFDFTRVGK